MTVLVCHIPFSPVAELDAYQQLMGDEVRRFGATVIFVGTMRDLNLGDEVTHMVLEHYPGMTERQLEQIVAEAQALWDLLDVLVIHRVGEITPGDSIVLVAVWTLHRGAAFEACRHIIEELKHNAPFWKKETVRDGERWGERNTQG